MKGGKPYPSKATLTPLSSLQMVLTPLQQTEEYSILSAHLYADPRHLHQATRWAHLTFSVAWCLLKRITVFLGALLGSGVCRRLQDAFEGKAVLALVCWYPCFVDRGCGDPLTC